jgi:hypothetical protein
MTEDSRRRGWSGPWTMLALTLALAQTGCGLVEASGDGNARYELQRARALWASVGVTTYELTVERFCYCGLVGPVRVTVRDGVTIDVRAVDAPTSDPALAAAYPDVPGLFDEVQAALDRRPHRLRVAYHPTLGYPTEISIDYRENVADDEIAYTASLRILNDDDWVVGQPTTGD